MTATAPTAPTTGGTVLDRNLGVLARGSPDAVRRLFATPPRSDLSFFDTDDGVPGAQLGTGSTARGLASRRRPLDEGERLVAPIDLADAAVYVVTGFGLGYHVRALAKRVKKTGLIVVFEPDAALLRAVLERVDHSAWMRETNLAILCDPADAAAMTQTLQGLEGLVGLGVRLVEHPLSRARLGDDAARFFETFKGVVGAIRLTLVTTLVQARTTLRNVFQNLDAYCVRPGVEDLKGVAAGRPAIVVSAGPSLARNIELLARPGVRERYTIVAVQTVLKPLLARGIRPHFVTALDYSDLSVRFYEGLTATDVEGITLVLDPKVNPAVVGAFPGEIRFQADRYADTLLGAAFARERGALPAGATVAHQAYYLARHMGCDPVVLVGQDLGFTDGQYYAAGAAIHDTWAPELNPFNTLETMEWQRIARMGTHLRRATDVLGRPVFTDEQMATYLAQFERDFKADAERGLTTIDATEGGVRKRYTEVETLAGVMGRLAGAPSGGLAPHHAQRARSEHRPDLSPVTERVRSVRRGVQKVGELSRTTETLLAEIAEHQKDQERVNRVIERIDRLRDEVVTLEPAFGLVQVVNQTGQLNRFRADRTLHVEAAGLTPLERQARQIGRDLENLRSLVEAADVLGGILEDAEAALGGAAKKTRDAVSGEAALTRSTAAQRAEEAAARSVRVPALVIVDPSLGGLGTARELGEPVAAGLNALEMTLRRLSRCERLSSIVVACEDPELAKALAGGWRGAAPLEFVRVQGPDPAWRRSVGAARAFARECWRGGIGGLTAYDEVCDPATLLRVMEAAGAEAALLVGADWCLVDPALCDAVIARHAENPAANRLTFTQAPPGLCGCVVARALAASLAAGARAGAAATIGGVLGYSPAAPVLDLIGGGLCVPVTPAVRDAGVRFVADGAGGRAVLAVAVDRLGSGWETADAGAVVRAVTEGHQKAAPLGPGHLVLEVLARSGEPLDLGLAHRLAGELASVGPGAAVSLTGPLATRPGAGADPLDHPALAEVVSVFRAAGVAAAHLRTPLRSERAVAPRILDIGTDVISVDLLAESESVYEAVAGRKGFAQARANLEALLAARAARPSPLPTPWVVPRLTRCDAAYAEVESFYTRWLTRCGWAVLDPLPQPRPGERIDPLSLPRSALRRQALTTMVVRADGSVPLGPAGDAEVVGDAAREPLGAVWTRLVGRRAALARERGDTHPSLRVAW